MDVVWLDVDITAEQAAAAVAGIRRYQPEHVGRVSDIYDWLTERPSHLATFALSRLDYVEDRTRHPFRTLLQVTPASRTSAQDVAKLCQMFSCRALMPRGQVNPKSDPALSDDPGNPYLFALFDPSGYRGVVNGYPVDEPGVAPEVANDEIPLLGTSRSTLTELG